RRIADAVPEVEVTAIPLEGDLPQGITGDVLLTLPWESPNLSHALGRGIRWVHALGTGIDAFPLHLLTDQTLTCSRGASAVPIAEWVLAVMLAFEKRLPEAWLRRVPAEGWSRRRLGTPARKTPGRWAAPPAPLAGIEVAPARVDLVASADHVVLAAPATAATRHLVDRTILAAVKPGAHLVNVARGALVDQDALRAALEDGPIAMASLDAVEPEPLP